MTLKHTAHVAPSNHILFTLGMIALGAMFPTFANADTVSRIINHGIDVSAPGQSNRGPTSYQVFDGSLFYSSANKLYRLDSIDGNYQEVPLPPPFDDIDRLFTSFATFDGSLYIIVRRNFMGFVDRFDVANIPGAVFRLSERNGQLTKVEMPITSDHPGYAGPPGIETAIGWPNRGSFAEYNGNLYYFGLEGYEVDGRFTATGCNSEPSIESLFRIEPARTEAVQIWLPFADMCKFHWVINGTEAGLNFISFSIVPRAGIDVNFIDHILSPRPLIDPPPSGISYNLVTRDMSHIRIPVLPIDPFVYGGRIFFRDVTQVGSEQFETELAHVDPISGELVSYDIYPRSSDDISSEPSGSFGSSNPQHFATAKGVLYFQASQDGENPELYRLLSIEAEPEALPLNPNGPTGAVPFGEYLDRLWFAADTGAGLDLHYLADDGVSAVPLGVGESIASSARGFAVFGDYVVFAAKDDDDNWGTYVVSIERDSPPPPDTPLTSTVLINDATHPEAPGLITRQHSRVTVQCKVHNNTDEPMRNVRILLSRVVRNGKSVKGNKQRRKRRIRCNYKALLPGETVTCRWRVQVQKSTNRQNCHAGAVASDGHWISTSDSGYVTGIRKPKPEP